MQPITIRLPEDVLETVDGRAEDRGESRSEYIRAHLTEGAAPREYDRLRGEYERLQHEYDDLRDEVDRLEDAVEQAEARAGDLRRQLREANARDDDVDELVAYVEEERAIQRRRAEREREREEAGLLTRGKWWLFGRPAEDDRDDVDEEETPGS